MFSHKMKVYFYLKQTLIYKYLCYSCLIGLFKLKFPIKIRPVANVHDPKQSTIDIDSYLTKPLYSQFLP